jgi:hypothetical protein
MNLVQKLGNDFFNNKFRGSYFLHEGVLHSIDGATGRSVVAYAYHKDPRSEGVTTSGVSLSRDVFPDASPFRVPDLGWRAYDRGRGLVYMSRNNGSYHRGLSNGNLVIATSAMTAALLRRNAVLRYNPPQFAHLAYFPEFLSFAEGMQKVRRGEIASFAVNHQVAVVPRGDGTMFIMFRNTVAGTVDHNGTVTMTNLKLNLEGIGA